MLHTGTLAMRLKRQKKGARARVARTDLRDETPDGALLCSADFASRRLRRRGSGLCAGGPPRHATAVVRCPRAPSWCRGTTLASVSLAVTSPHHRVSCVHQHVRGDSDSPVVSGALFPVLARAQLLRSRVARRELLIEGGRTTPTGPLGDPRWKNGHLRFCVSRALRASTTPSLIACTRIRPRSLPMRVCFASRARRQCANYFPGVAS